MPDLPDTYFVTGCASGIGYHIANRLVQSGKQILATDVNADALHARAQQQDWPGDRVALAAFDVRDPNAWESTFAMAVERFGTIDVCMNIAGILKSSWVHETSLKDVNDQIDINTKGVIFGTQVAARHMIPRQRGHIVNFASMAGIAPIPGLAAYTASKFAVRGFSIAAAGELRRHGVAVTLICPDGVDTPLLDLPADNDAAALIFSGKRLLTVEEIGNVIFDRVLTRRPVEVALPFSRKLLAKFGSLFPGLTLSIVPMLQRKGRKAHRRRARD